MKIKGLFPYLVSVLASSFIQMGLFLFFEQWVKYSLAKDSFDLLYNGAPLMRKKSTFRETKTKGVF